MSSSKSNNNKPPGQIEGYSLEHLLKTAKDVVDRKTKHSVVLDREAEARIPKFHAKGTLRVRSVSRR